MRVCAGLPADTLQGHRDRFQEQFKKYGVPSQSNANRKKTTWMQFQSTSCLSVTQKTELFLPSVLHPPPPPRLPPSRFCPPLVTFFKSISPFGFRLKSLFYRSSNLQYFKRLIQIPQLPEVRTTDSLDRLHIDYTFPACCLKQPRCLFLFYPRLLAYHVYFGTMTNVNL